MDLKLKDKVAIVGGASMGIGYGIARTLAEEGAKVAITARREPALRQAAETSCARRPAATCCRCRATAAAPRIASGSWTTVAAEWGGVDILVNNDGAPPLGDIMTLDDTAWQKAIEQNLMYVVRMVREAVPHMIQRGGGSVVNITAISAIQPYRRIRPVGGELGRRDRLRQDAVAGTRARPASTSTPSVPDTSTPRGWKRCSPPPARTRASCAMN